MPAFPRDPGHSAHLTVGGSGSIALLSTCSTPPCRLEDRRLRPGAAGLPWAAAAGWGGLGAILGPEEEEGAALGTAGRRPGGRRNSARQRARQQACGRRFAPRRGPGLDSCIMAVRTACTLPAAAQELCGRASLLRRAASLRTGPQTCACAHAQRSVAGLRTPCKRRVKAAARRGRLSSSGRSKRTRGARWPCSSTAGSRAPSKWPPVCKTGVKNPAARLTSSAGAGKQGGREAGSSWLHVGGIPGGCKPGGRRLRDNRPRRVTRLSTLTRRSGCCPAAAATPHQQARASSRTASL